MHIRAVTLAFVLAFPLLAAKPPVGAEVEREAWRDRAVLACVAEQRPDGDHNPEYIEQMCGCALDRFVAGRDAGALPPIRPGRLSGLIARDLLACNAELSADRTPAVIAPPVAPKPPPDEEVAAEELENPFEPWAWLRGLALPAWLAALPAWAWILLGLLAVFLIGGLMRRRDDRQHLLGPPPSMRRGGPPIAPRLPNPPPPR